MLGSELQVILMIAVKTNVILHSTKAVNIIVFINIGVQPTRIVDQDVSKIKTKGCIAQYSNYTGTGNMVFDEIFEYSFFIVNLRKKKMLICNICFFVVLSLN